MPRDNGVLFSQVRRETEMMVVHLSGFSRETEPMGYMESNLRGDMIEIGPCSYGGPEIPRRPIDNLEDQERAGGIQSKSQGPRSRRAVAKACRGMSQLQENKFPLPSPYCWVQALDRWDDDQ